MITDKLFILQCWICSAVVCRWQFSINFYFFMHNVSYILLRLHACLLLSSSTDARSVITTRKRAERVGEGRAGKGCSERQHTKKRDATNQGSAVRSRSSDTGHGGYRSIQRSDSQQISHFVC